MSEHALQARRVALNRKLRLRESKLTQADRRRLAEKVAEAVREDGIKALADWQWAEATKGRQTAGNPATQLRLLDLAPLIDKLLEEE